MDVNDTSNMFVIIPSNEARLESVNGSIEVWPAVTEEVRKRIKATFDIIARRPSCSTCTARSWGTNTRSIN